MVRHSPGEICDGPVIGSGEESTVRVAGFPAPGGVDALPSSVSVTVRLVPAAVLSAASEIDFPT